MNFILHQIISGSEGDCQDWGVVISGFSFGALLAPPDGCTSTLLSNKTLQLNRWYYVVVTSDGKTIKLYVDGNLQGTAKVFENKLYFVLVNVELLFLKLTLR